MRGQPAPENPTLEVIDPPNARRVETLCPLRKKTPEKVAGFTEGRDPTQAENPGGTASSPGSRARILIVESDAEDRRAFSSILRREGHWTESTDSGDVATARVREKRFDLALVGIKLLDEDGIGLIWPLKEIQPDLGVIMTTGSGSTEASIRALYAGAWAYIVKPAAPEMLLATVRQARERQLVVRAHASLAAAVEQERKRREQVEREVHHLESRVADYTVREQERIGRELHDALGQQLTGAGLIAKSIQNRIEERAADDLREDMEELVKTIQEAQEEVRRLARGLCGRRMDSRGLMLALDDLAVSATRRTGVHVYLECDGNTFFDDDEVFSHLYHIAQEAVSNAVRHSEPDRVVIALHTENGRITLEVRDDGGGFAGEEGGKEGMGLRIMRYRAERIGGRFNIRSSPGQGTTVRCTFPERSASA